MRDDPSEQQILRVKQHLALDPQHLCRERTQQRQRQGHDQRRNDLETAQKERLVEKIFLTPYDRLQTLLQNLADNIRTDQHPAQQAHLDKAGLEVRQERVRRAQEKLLHGDTAFQDQP